MKAIWRIDKEEARSAHGVVATMNMLAAEAGRDVLARGGNAVDAAVATAFALAVAEPFNSGIGGGGAMVIHLAKERLSATIDFSAVAPASARPDMYEVGLAEDPSLPWFWRSAKDGRNLVGHASVGVPGAVAGLVEALQSYGTMSLGDVLAPAIQLAEEGYEADWYLTLRIANSMRDLARFPETARVLLKSGFPPLSATFAAGERIVQTDLAATLRRIAREGAAGFYEGPVAKAIADDMRANDGFLTEGDLRSYRAEHSTSPVRGTYRGLEIIATGPHTGGTPLIEALNILEGWDLSALDPGSPERAHLLAETFRVVFADWYANGGDPRFVEVPADVLHSKEHAARLREGIDPARANLDPVLSGLGSTRASSAALAPVASAPRGSTTHLSVMDADRNAVALTNTLGLSFGSKVTSPGTGVLLHDMMFLFDPATGTRNSVAGGKRPLFPVAPVVVLKDGKPLICVGAPGDVKIITAVAQVIINVVDHGMSAQQAITAPRIHCHGPETAVNERLGEAVVEGLRRRGQLVEVKEDSFSALSFAFPAAVVDHGEFMSGGVDPLKPSRALGVSKENS